MSFNHTTDVLAKGYLPFIHAQSLKSSADECNGEEKLQQTAHSHMQR